MPTICMYRLLPEALEFDTKLLKELVPITGTVVDAELLTELSTQYPRCAGRTG